MEHPIIYKCEYRFIAVVDMENESLLRAEAFITYMPLIETSLLKTSRDQEIYVTVKN